MSAAARLLRYLSARLPSGFFGAWMATLRVLWGLATLRAKVPSEIFGPGYPPGYLGPGYVTMRLGSLRSSRYSPGSLDQAAAATQFHR